MRTGTTTGTAMAHDIGARHGYRFARTDEDTRGVLIFIYNKYLLLLKLCKITNYINYILHYSTILKYNTFIYYYQL
jgi:hypothetical protein